MSRRSFVPGKVYTREQMEHISRVATEGERAGFVLQHDLLSDTFKIVPWQKSVGASLDGDKLPTVASGLFTPPDPIVKRSGQERMSSFITKVMETFIKEGGVPGMSDERMSAIIGQKWVKGISVVTEDVVRRVLRHFLEEAEVAKSRADFKKIVTPSPND